MAAEGFRVDQTMHGSRRWFADLKTVQLQHMSMVTSSFMNNRVAYPVLYLEGHSDVNLPPIANCRVVTDADDPLGSATAMAGGMVNYLYAD
jgi:hypothetical protein